MLILIPAAWGLVAGAILTIFPRAKGFGSDEAIESIHHKKGHIPWYLVPSTLFAGG
ncbi:MAG TPA: hypothetical protein HA366_02975 [Candidatus Methanomethylophilaceae archaeon]|nr:hypothetical protein [Candidatus Methanomethylophilaceae archaeon]